VFKNASGVTRFQNPETMVHGDMKVLLIEVGEFWGFLFVSTYLSEVELAMLGGYFSKIVERDFGIA